MARTKLTAYLVKNEYRNHNYSQLVRNQNYHSYPIKGNLNIEGQIILGFEQEKPPDWLSFLELGTDEDIPNMSNKSTRAVIFIKYLEHLLIFAHGQGRHMIKENVYEKDFGLKVVLNSIHPDNLRSIDSVNIDISSIQTRSQSNRDTEIRNLNFDVVSDLLRSVTGTPEYNHFGKVISGRDSFHFTYEFNNGFRDFNEICQILVEKYNSEDYMGSFSWVDNLQKVEDKETIDELDGLLVEQINNNVEEISIGIPEIVDYTSNHSYSYTEKGEKYEDLNIQDYYERVETFSSVSIKQIKSHYIYSHDNENDGYVDKWNVYSCLIFETFLEDTIYILTVGEWFKVDRDYANQVRNYIQGVDDYELELPACRVNESEPGYNNRISSGNSLPNMINMDRKNLSFNNSQIELCDLLTDSNELIHVKKWYGSSTLSHLFSQGRVSGELLLREESFRQEAINKINEIDTNYAHIIPLTNYLSSNMTIVFAIIDKDERELHERLPFFSILNMMQTVEYLKGLGYKVKKTKILQEIE
ncbi:hypothetical protein GCM10008932_17270 [Alkalibacterium iburiense]|uniref:Sporadically distributed protein, TIGR04141 family n=1 Tax=Alkalibacterium iburiense TaxID=290589 RepID=A0ABN0XJD7_9LACT